MMAQVRRSDLAALWNEKDRLWAENRLLREKIATTWELGRLEGVAVYNDAVIPVPTGEWYPLPFNSERRDDAGFHSTTSNTSRLTVPAGKAGWYVISGHIAFDVSGVGTIRMIAIQFNGVTHIGYHLNTPQAGTYHGLSIATVYPLSATDFVELVAYQDTGSNLNVISVGNYSSEFRMVRVR